MKTKEIKPTLKDTIDEIEKRFGDGSIMKLSNAKAVDVDVISTGSIGLDLALGISGFPRGRVIEVFGSEASGKTTLSLHIIAEAQKKGLACAFIDAEHAMSPDWAKKIGVNTDKLLISQPNCGEEALDLAGALIESGNISVVVIDSVAALVPRAEIDGEMGSQQIGLQARMMGKALRKLTGPISKTNTCVIFINQTRANIGFGGKTTTPGGKALKFSASVRVQLARISNIGKTDKFVGSRIKAKIVKNKVAAPFKVVEFDIHFDEGISYTADIVNTGILKNVLTRKGAWYWFGEIQLGQGMERTKTFLKENNKVLKEIKKAILEIKK